MIGWKVGQQLPAAGHQHQLPKALLHDGYQPLCGQAFANSDCTSSAQLSRPGGLLFEAP